MEAKKRTEINRSAHPRACLWVSGLHGRPWERLLVGIDTVSRHEIRYVIRVGVLPYHTIRAAPCCDIHLRGSNHDFSGI